MAMDVGESVREFITVALLFIRISVFFEDTIPEVGKLMQQHFN